MLKQKFTELKDISAQLNNVNKEIHDTKQSSDSNCCLYKGIYIFHFFLFLFLEYEIEIQAIKQKTQEEKTVTETRTLLFSLLWGQRG